MFDVPVVFVVFNRPDTTRQVWERIRSVRPRQLFVIADGPRENRHADAERCAEVRNIVGAVDWTCDLRTDYSDRNLGAAVRVSSGIDWVFTIVEQAIILEDDCLPDPTFFPFCRQLLMRYRDDHRIAQIAGCSFQVGVPKRHSYYFSRYTHSWGWATWRRAWQRYDHSMRVWQTTRGANWLPEMVRNPAEREIWAQSFDQTLAGHVDAWDYRWTSAVWSAGMLSLVPYRNLISNIGFGPDATHTKGYSPWAALRVSAMEFPLVHPTAFAPDDAADDHTSKTVFRPPSWPLRLRRFCAKLVHR